MLGGGAGIGARRCVYLCIIDVWIEYMTRVEPGWRTQLSRSANCHHPLPYGVTELFIQDISIFPINFTYSLAQNRDNTTPTLNLKDHVSPVSIDF